MLYVLIFSLAVILFAGLILSVYKGIAKYRRKKRQSPSEEEQTEH